MRGHSWRQERVVAKDIGGRVQPASGALWDSKDDVRAPFEIRLEVKTTDRGFYRFNINAYLQVWRRAIASGETPGFLVEFRPEKRSIIITSPEVSTEGIREVRYPKKSTYLLTASEVHDLDLSAYRAGIPYLLALQFPETQVIGISYRVFLGAECPTSSHGH